MGCLVTAARSSWSVATTSYSEGHEDHVGLVAVVFLSGPKIFGKLFLATAHGVVFLAERKLQTGQC